MLECQILLICLCATMKLEQIGEIQSRSSIGFLMFFGNQWHPCCFLFSGNQKPAVSVKRYMLKACKHPEYMVRVEVRFFFFQASSWLEDVGRKTSEQNQQNNRTF